MQLLADRFVITEEGRVFDLASGEAVQLRTGAEGGPTDQARWTLRCDRFVALRHRAFAPLVDSGRFGERLRFEAWRAGGRWRGAEQVSARTVAAAQKFLRALGLSAASLAPASVHTLGARAVVVPDDECGLEPESSDGLEVGTLPLDTHGLMWPGRSEVGALSELFADVATVPRVIAIWGPEGAGLGFAIDELARAARTTGLVPVRSSLIDAGLAGVLEGRALLLISRDPSESRARQLIEWTLGSPRGHVMLLAGRTEVAGVPGIPLRRIGTATLVGAVRPSLSGTLEEKARQMARRANGLPGRFASLLWGEVRLAPTSAVRQTRWRVAERAVGPEDGLMVPHPPPAADRDRTWPSPGELAALRQRAEAAVRELDKGSWAVGDRILRPTIVALARRHDWDAAVRGVVALASALLKRGRPRDAAALLAVGREYAAQSAEDGLLRDVALLTGVAWTDVGKLDDAEAILRTIVAPLAAGAGTPAERLALARCLFWRGQFDEGQTVVSDLNVAVLAGPVSVLAALMASKLAVGRQSLGEAVSRAAAALDAARVINNPSLLASAAYVSAFAHLAVGDYPSVDRDVETCLRAARLAHDPLRALKTRLIAVERARRSGRTGPAAALLRRIARMSRLDLPAPIRAPCDLLGDLLTETPPAQAVRRREASTGLRALGVFVPASHHEGASVLNLAVDDSVEILRCCQTAEDERAVLTAVCARLKSRLNAAAAAFFGRSTGRATLAMLVSEGRVEPSIAERVVAAGTTIAPHASGESVEAGALVRYGGESFGVLAVRWALGSAFDPSRAAVGLTMAAAAAGPAVAALVERQGRTDRGSADELLGVSQSVDEVRRAIERTAAAPFAVLIHGESGTGKELVARALHRRSPRHARPFCTLNCAALPEDLVEAELFGHARGAFTGALGERAGVFEEAHTGTLFLDEVGELSARAQAKMLRAIQEGEVRRVGENVPRRINTRIVSATNRDLAEEAAAGRFRIDLLYRLDVIRILLPPLRDRREDIAVLVARYWREAVERVESRATLSSATIAALTRYDWPGNVRELQNVLASLAVRSPRRGVVPPTALPAVIAGAETPDRSWRLDAARRSFDERFVRAALVRSGGHRTRAAGELGLSRQGLTKLMARLGITDR